MKTSRRELSIDTVIDRGFLKKLPNYLPVLPLLLQQVREHLIIKTFGSFLQ